MYHPLGWEVNWVQMARAVLVTGAGSGIGLAATKKRIEAHNGTIGFESEPGKGTTFRVRIPIARSAEVVPKSDGA